MNFIKMHGLGNDFMLLDGVSQSIDISSLSITNLADRNIGIGFDQLLLLLPSSHADVFCKIFNSDGSEAKQCGNGMRCVARYLCDSSIATNKDKISIETISGVVEAKVYKNNIVEVNMGIANLSGWQTLQLPNIEDEIKIFVVEIGNQHGILHVNNLEDIDINLLGKIISKNAYFPDEINVGFMQIIDKQTIALKTYERGAGITHACGSNACAAAITAISEFNLNSSIKVKLSLGDLQIDWKNKFSPVLMCGPAVTVFSGTF